MTEHFLKRAVQADPVETEDLRARVAAHLAEIERGGEPAARALAQRLDGWQGDFVIGEETLDAACARVPAALREAIDYALENITRFARAQRATLTEMEVELRPGLRAGQRVIPLRSAGCYVPGGRYAHVASALMTVATARAAGVRHVAAVSPPRKGAEAGVPDPVLYALHAAGAERILALGGIQGIAAMAFGLFGLEPADILVGPGNPYVTEAKRQLFGRVGIDMVAGPTDVMILADGEQDATRIAWDLVAQAEHGANSPVWLVTDDEPLARRVAEQVPLCAARLPEPNRQAALAAWQALGAVVLCPDREAMARYADRIGPEHLHVQAADPAWWHARLASYGALFLGAGTTVAFGDKAAGPNHVLPTSGAARYTGGLSVHKFLKVVTWQSAEAPGRDELARVSACLSRAEGMEGHARSADLRRSAEVSREGAGMRQ